MMTPLERSDPFYSPKSLLIDVEAERLRLDETIGAFLDQKPFGTKIELSPDGKWLEQKIFTTVEIPRDIETAARRMVQDSRHALDQAISTVCSSGKPYFPVGTSRDDFENKCQKLVEKNSCPAAVVDAIREFEPFFDLSTKEGSYPIWAMHEVCNDTKHNLIMPVPVSVGRTVWDFVTVVGPTGPAQLGVHEPWNWERNETVVNRFQPTARVSYKAQMELKFKAVSERAHMDHDVIILSSMYWIACGIVKEIKNAFLARPKFTAL
ncbi:MAG: hypothetical protein QM785_12395 [Pyrinomonadaceae bacterium]